MAGKRSYEDACGAAHALDLVGERWALLVVRELVFGPKRFTDLRAGLPGISPNVLTQRLEELEQSSVLRRHKLPPPAAAWVYELTEWGLELEPVIMALGRWGSRSPARPAQMPPISTDSLVMSFKTMFDPAAAAGLDGRLQLSIGESRFRLEFKRGRLELQRGRFDAPDATLEALPDPLAGVVYGGYKLADAVRAGDVRVEGDKQLIKRFLGLFPLPPAAPVTSTAAIDASAPPATGRAAKPRPATKAASVTAKIGSTAKTGSAAKAASSARASDG